MGEGEISPLQGDASQGMQKGGLGGVECRKMDLKGPMFTGGKKKTISKVAHYMVPCINVLKNGKLQKWRLA